MWLTQKRPSLGTWMFSIRLQSWSKWDEPGCQLKKEDLEVPPKKTPGVTFSYRWANLQNWFFFSSFFNWSKINNVPSLIEVFFFCVFVCTKYLTKYCLWVYILYFCPNQFWSKINKIKLVLVVCVSTHWRVFLLLLQSGDSKVVGTR